MDTIDKSYVSDQKYLSKHISTMISLELSDLLMHYRLSNYKYEFITIEPQKLINKGCICCNKRNVQLLCNFIYF